MNKLTRLLICTTFTFAVSAAQAQNTAPKTEGMDRDGMHKDAMNKDAMNKDGSMQRAPSMQECRDHVAMAKKTNPASDAGSRTSNDEAMKKMDSTCAGMMNKDAAGTTPASKY